MWRISRIFREMAKLSFHAKTKHGSKRSPFSTSFYLHNVDRRGANQFLIMESIAQTIYRRVLATTARFRTFVQASKLQATLSKSFVMKQSLLPDHFRRKIFAWFARASCDPNAIFSVIAITYLGYRFQTVEPDSLPSRQYHLISYFGIMGASFRSI